jgi:hypothetical protein
MISSPADPGTPDSLRLSVSGSAFEVWQGPTGAIRYDWTRAGVIRVIIVGHGHASYATPSIKNYDTVLHFTGRISVLFDYWDMTGYDTEFRVKTSAWAAKHQSLVDSGYMVTRSKLVAMGVSVVNLVIGGKIKAVSNRAEFDQEAKRVGFMLNPPMPGK